jgi:tetratricopeptide (TPR) repeat protein
MSGLGHEKIGRLTAAIQTYLAIKPGSTFYLHANFRSIQLYLQLDDVDNAVELAEKIIASDEGQQKKDFYLVLAQIYADRQAFDDAIATLVKAYKQYPSELVFLFTQAVYYEKKGEYSACVDVLKQVISNDASHAVALNFLGYLYAERGENLDQAEELIKRALEIRPGDGFFLDSLGWVYFQKKDYPLALETLLKANELTPNEGVILEHIAETYQALGDRKKALEFMEAATKSRLEKRDKSRIIEKYEEMKKS